MTMMTPISPFEELADHGLLGEVPWWRQRMFVAKGWTYKIWPEAADLPTGDEATA